MTVTLAVSAKTPRSSYVDTLRALAIVRVYVHHTLWISWLTTLFPSMWVMFALAGLLTARSIDSRGGRDTVRARFRRTLPPLWGLAVVVVPLMSRPSMFELLIETSKVLCNARPVEMDSESDTVSSLVPELAGYSVLARTRTGVGVVPELTWIVTVPSSSVRLT